jgi:hypothetical protein
MRKRRRHLCFTNSYRCTDSLPLALELEVAWMTAPQTVLTLVKAIALLADTADQANHRREDLRSACVGRKLTHCGWALWWTRARRDRRDQCMAARAEPSGLRLDAGRRSRSYERSPASRLMSVVWLASHSDRAPAGGTAGVSGDTDTIYAVHTCAARFANCNDQPARLLDLHGWHSLCRRCEGQDKGNSNPSDHRFSPICGSLAASHDARLRFWIICDQ